MEKQTERDKMIEFTRRIEALEDQLKAPGDANTMSNAELTAAVRRLDSLIGSALISLTRRVSELEGDINNKYTQGCKVSTRKMVVDNARKIAELTATVHRIDKKDHAQDAAIDMLDEDNKNRVSEIQALENMLLTDDEEPVFSGDQLDEVCRLKKELEVTQQNLDTYIERFEKQEKKLQAAARAFEAHGYKHPQGVFDQFEDKGDAEIKRLEDELESVGDGLKRTQGRLDMEKIWANLLYNGLKDAKNALQDESASNFGARKKALDIILGINNDPNLYRVESDRKDQQ